MKQFENSWASLRSWLVSFRLRLLQFMIYPVCRLCQRRNSHSKPKGVFFRCLWSETTLSCMINISTRSNLVTMATSPIPIYTMATLPFTFDFEYLTWFHKHTHQWNMTKCFVATLNFIGYTMINNQQILVQLHSVPQLCNCLQTLMS